MAYARFGGLSPEAAKVAGASAASKLKRREVPSEMAGSEEPMELEGDIGSMTLQDFIDACEDKDLKVAVVRAANKLGTQPGESVDMLDEGSEGMSAMGGEEAGVPA